MSDALASVSATPVKIEGASVFRPSRGAAASGYNAQGGEAGGMSRQERTYAKDLQLSDC